MHKINRLTALAATAIAAVSLAACANPKAASDANFANAINQYLASGGNGSSLCFQSVYFPHPDSPYDRDDTRAQLSEMAGAGLISKQSKMVKVAQWFGPPILQRQVTYDLTKGGKAHVASNESYVGSSFCFAKLRVGQIVKFTEPNDMAGVTVSQVTYVPAVASMEPWAEQLLEQKKLASMQRLVDRTVSTANNATLDLTNKGWEVAQ